MDNLAETIAYALSLGIIAGSMVYKLPQVLAIQRAQSGDGISLLSVELEILSSTFSLLYSYWTGFPFMTYGEASFVILFDWVILYMVLLYSRPMGHRVFGMSAAAVYSVALAACLLLPLLPPSVLTVMQATVTPIVIFSRLPQIVQNYNTGSTGQLSLVTWFLNFGGSMARVATTLISANDPLILAVFTIAGLLNGVMVAQIVYYSMIRPKKIKTPLNSKNTKQN